MEIIKTIDDYLNINNHSDNFFTIYPFTTENIDGYMQFFNLKNNSLLTVGSSLDQAINAILAGCKDVTVYDICPLTKYFYYLKLASLLILDKEEFLDFLCKTNYQSNTEYNPKLFNIKTYNKIRKTLKELDYDSFVIWTYIFNKYKRKDIEKLFRRDINSLECIIHCNRYLKNEYNYKRIRTILPTSNISIINGNITSIDLNKKFTNIWLSNISKYLSYSDIDKMISQTMSLLEDNGKLLMTYYYYDKPYINPLNDTDAFDKYDYIKRRVDGLSKNHSKNCIFIYNKSSTESREKSVTNKI